MTIVETREGTGLCGHTVNITVRQGPHGEQAVTPDLCESCQAYCDALPAVTETIVRERMQNSVGAYISR